MLLVLRKDPLLALRPLEPLAIGDVAVLREEVVHAHREVALLRRGRPARPPPASDVTRVGVGVGVTVVIRMLLLVVAMTGDRVVIVMVVVAHVVIVAEEGVLEKLERVQDAHRALHHLLPAGVDVDDVVGTAD